MTLVSDQAEADMRRRIVVEAERLFREIGYQKTTVADIAKRMRMSPANVYRFYDSKKSIHVAVAQRLMGEVEVAMQAIAHGSGTPTARLRELLTSVHQMNSERYVGDEKLHEMVAIAMEESWEVCVAHMEQVSGVIAGLLVEGDEAGEFRIPDAALAAQCTCTAMLRFFHPQMIAQCANKPGPTLDQMVDFVLASFAAPAKK